MRGLFGEREPAVWPYLAAFSAMGAVLASWWLATFVAQVIATGPPAVLWTSGVIAAATPALASAVTRWVARETPE